MSAHEPHPESVPYDEVGRESHPVPPPSTLEVIVAELLAAVPEVRDSLLSAADSLLDAARAVIDAADHVVFPNRAEDDTE
ncbi:MAG TPA: hypothetical protein VFZ17_05750 [Acidimicrobiia bacterium]|nr:hypothetical protein [Acidimicrobiia bacterium]